MTQAEKQLSDALDVLIAIREADPEWVAEDLLDCECDADRVCFGCRIDRVIDWQEGRQ